MRCRRVPAVLVTLRALAACGSPPPARPDPPGATAPPRVALDGELTVVAPEVISTEATEIRLATSPDGALVLWGSTNRPGGRGGWDVWMARRDGAGFTAPVAAPFDSDANDFDPAFSPDGAWVYFFSNRPGGAGGDDLYRAAVRTDGFGAAEHLGPEVNTAGDEWAPTPAPDGGLLYASNRPGEHHDLYFAAARGDGFAPGAPLPGALNTDADEFDATFLADGQTVVFARSPDVEHDPIALYVATRDAGGYAAATALPAAVNAPGGYALGPSIDPRDPAVLYVSTGRPTSHAGSLDIWQVRYRLDR